jgi:hypothetical protein
MKKIKTILGLVTVLGLLLMAACDQGITPTDPDLGNYNDSRTNQKYTDNVIKGTNYFPGITPASNTFLNGGNNPNVAENSVVEIDFTNAVEYAADLPRPQTLDILKGDVAANIKKAIIFEGVKYAISPTVLYDYSPLTYEVMYVDREIVYVQLPNLGSYDQVQAHIKASEYKISGRSIDTDGNLKGGEDPYDDYYGNGGNYLFSVVNGANNLPVGIAKTKGDFSLTGFSYDNGTSVSNTTYTYAASYLDFSDDKTSYSGLNAYLKLEKWYPSTKTWGDPVPPVNGLYGTVAPYEGEYYFNISYPNGENTYDRYRLVAVDLYKFETGEVRGLKRHFRNYPGTNNDPVTIKDGKKVLDDRIFVTGTNYFRTHTSSGNIFSNKAVYTDEQGKNAVLVLDADTTQGGPLGTWGFTSSSSDFTNSNNFRLAYKTGSDPADVYKYIGITKAELRSKPGVIPVQQQLVLTLDPNYTWVNGRTITVYAKAGITFGGDNPAVYKLAGSLGDANGVININGDYTWGQYDDINVTAGAVN